MKLKKKQNLFPHGLSSGKRKVTILDPFLYLETLSPHRSFSIHLLIILCVLQGVSNSISTQLPSNLGLNPTFTQQDYAQVCMLFQHLVARVTGEVCWVLKPECPSSQSPAAAATNIAFREVGDVRSGSLPDSGHETILKFSVVKKIQNLHKPLWASIKLYRRIPEKGCALLPHKVCGSSRQHQHPKCGVDTCHTQAGWEQNIILPYAIYLILWKSMLRVYSPNIFSKIGAVVGCPYRQHSQGLHSATLWFLFPLLPKPLSLFPFINYEIILFITLISSPHPPQAR